jgi:hypothetical protein
VIKMTTDELGKAVLTALDEMNDPNLSDVGRETLAGFAERMLAQFHNAQQSDWYYEELEKRIKDLRK